MLSETRRGKKQTNIQLIKITRKNGVSGKLKPSYHIPNFCLSCCYICGVQGDNEMFLKRNWEPPQF